MSLRARLQEQLRRWDDDTFVALANRGLLRRAGKDLETTLPVVVAESDTAMDVEFASHRLRFDARGPAQASCSCPTSGVCQHILAVALWLQKGDSNVSGTAAAAEGASLQTDTPTEGHSNPLATLQAELLDLSQTALTKHAGKPGYRWAWQFVQDLDPERGLRLSGGKNIVIGFARPRVDFRYPGGGLDALIADAEVGDTAKYRVAAVLAYQRAHGMEIHAPEASGGQRTAALDLGQDHALPETGHASLHESRARLRAGVRKLLSECVELGLSHLSQAIAERFATLAVWAQGADYHRLARLLRRVADHVELLLARAGSADEHRLFEEATLVHALVAALDAADARGAAPKHLVGRARNRYESLGELELLGLGALPWRASSGYVGLTMLFWSPAEQAFHSCTDARPEGQQGGFDPVKRYRQAGPRTGLGAPEQSTGRRVRLTDAQASDLGQLSATEKASAKVETITPADFVSALVPVSSWRALDEARTFMRRSLLTEPEPLRDWVVLQPAQCRAARFDSNRQVLCWPLLDADGATLECEIAYSPLSQPAIDRLQSLTPATFVAGTLVVARIRDAGGTLVAEPLSLVHTNNACAVDALYFDAAPAQSLISKAVAGLRQITQQAPIEAPPTIRSNSLPPALNELRVFLRRQAERGVGAAADPAIRMELDTFARRLSDVGIRGFGLAAGISPTEQILRTHYLQLQMMRLLGASDQNENEAD